MNAKRLAKRQGLCEITQCFKWAWFQYNSGILQWSPPCLLSLEGTTKNDKPGGQLRCSYGYSSGKALVWFQSGSGKPVQLHRVIEANLWCVTLVVFKPGLWQNASKPNAPPGRVSAPAPPSQQPPFTPGQSTSLLLGLRWDSGAKVSPGMMLSLCMLRWAGKWV